MEGLTWIPHVFSLEIKKAIAYRVAFWIEFILSVGTELAVAYFLWNAIFEGAGAHSLNGYTFHGILFYYVFAAFGVKVIQGSIQGIVSAEIYDGALTRYLLYPVSYLQYVYVGHLARQVFAVGQLLLGFLLLTLVFGLPSDLSISPMSFLVGILTSIIAGFVFFLMNTCLELVAFFQDTVWNLLAMLRFIGSLLGGTLIPLAFFPEWGQEVVRYTPFPLLYSFPIQCFLGKVSVFEWWTQAIQLFLWAIFLGWLSSWIWSKGRLNYTGVGQ